MKTENSKDYRRRNSSDILHRSKRRQDYPAARYSRLQLDLHTFRVRKERLDHRSGALRRVYENISCTIFSAAFSPPAL